MIAAGTIRTDRRDVMVLIALAVTLFFLLLLSLSVGQLYIPVNEIGEVFLQKLGLFSLREVDTVHEMVLFNIRLPRLVMTVLVGLSLGVSGASLQGLFRNPLVEPGLIGVSSGASLAVVFVIVFGAALLPEGQSWAMSLVTSVFAFAGGLLATWGVMQIGRRMGQTSIAMLVLAGVAVNALCGALMGLLIYHATENQLHMFTFWTLGDLGGASWSSLLVAAPFLLGGSYVLLRQAPALNAMALGEAEAFHMGVDVHRSKRLIILCAALSVGAAVSLAGAIGFVGLIVPHWIRVMFHSDNRLVLPASALAGPILLIVADMVARVIVSPAEMPIGIVTALFGAPVFIFLLVRSQIRNHD